MKVLFLSLFLGLSAFAIEYPIETPIENPNLVCASKGGSIFINTVAKRVWQGDSVQDTVGIEYKIKSKDFLTYRCPNCYKITGKLPMMKKNESIGLKTEAVMGRFDRAKLTMTLIAGNEVIKLPDMECAVR